MTIDDDLNYDNGYGGIADDDDEFEFDCGLDQRGQCALAGSEDCDFECPWNQPPYRYGRLERKKKSLPLFPKEQGR